MKSGTNSKVHSCLVSGSSGGQFPFAFLKECYEEEKMEWPIKSLDVCRGSFLLEHYVGLY